MIPSIVARQVRETVLDYLRTTFALADPDFERALFDFLDGEDGLFKGPYFDVRLPFRKADPSEHVPLEIGPSFEPYRHQLKAFERLCTEGGHQPEPTLVTTGTGSGKTECFLFPILDHCWRNRETPGVKAIVLYPMNALASDQARRLAETLWTDGRLRGEVTAGLYVGGNGQHGAADQQHLVDKRGVLRDSPPDILLTNYKMLDFLLLRPEDRRLWRHNGPDTLRYLVLDELHTYDGAQGSDVACLIRRLKRRLACAAGSVCPVGTSATIGGAASPETIRALTEFASKVFDEKFLEDGVITEDRCDAGETLGNLVDLDRFPGAEQVAELQPEIYSDAAAWLCRQAELWLGEDAGSLDPVAIGRCLDRHEFLRQLLKVLAGELLGWPELDARLGPRVPEWGQFNENGRRWVLESFLGLVSHARRPAPTPGAPNRDEPFLAVHSQLWLRELRHLARRVLPPSVPPVFSWNDGTLRTEPGPDRHWLPIAHCRECGAAGFATFQRESESVLQTEVRAIGRSWLTRNRSCRYVAFGHEEGVDEFPEYLCPGCLSVQWGDSCDYCDPVAEGDTNGGKQPTIPIRIGANLSDGKPPRFLAACPDCSSERSLSILGSRAPSLLSVAISHLYQSDFNSDKKLLAFTDSVQDASHRAGFFGARTYRFNLRTAMQAVVEGSTEPIPLAELGERLWAHWKAQMERPKLIPALLPSDLRALPEYERFLERGGAGTHRTLEDALKRRLSWEAVMEYGLNARVGRTLESTLCSTVQLSPVALARAADVLGLDIAERGLVSGAPSGGFSRDVIEHFLRGLLLRLRIHGGLHHPFLNPYVRSGGNRFHLTKRRQPLMSPFGQGSVLPRFLTDRRRVSGDTPVFDTYQARGKGPYPWHQDWAARSLSISITDPGLNELFRETLRRLEDAKLVVRHDLDRSGSAWGLDAARLFCSAPAVQVACPECRRRVPVPEDELPHWESRPCIQYRCPGRFRIASDRESTYYGRIYRSGRVKRIFAQEHTGLLEREERERVEEKFKAGVAPGAPNLLVCTPTLEMGIDIGDLSAAMLCSVPPTTSNFLQRVGRAGRKTGNAFCLTLANSRPHDLYFHAEPTEMMAGQVLPPGCFLDAPDMLRRQIAAYAMDAWARQETEVKQIPSQTGFVLGDAGRRTFPGRFIDFYREHREELTDSFLDCFDDHLSLSNRERLEAFGKGDLVPGLVTEAFAAIDTELKELRNLQNRAKLRLQEIENKPDSVSDPDLEKAELENTRKLLGRLALALRHKYPLNVLTDEGVLPNYAFPEPGVKLESVISHTRDDGQRDYEASEYMRPASSAIRELAPFNTFYADGRKVRIDEIDVGSPTRPLIEDWRLCQACSHMRREYAEQPVEPECPRCSDLNWSDSGQVRSLVHFRKARSLATRLEASTVDDSDDREEEFYGLRDLIDVGPEHYSGARLIEELPFGYELLKDLTLREVNFGLDGPMAQHGFRVCGEPAGDRGFEVCLECGRVKRGDDPIGHRATCRARKTGVQEKTRPLYLYREVQSEAIRILLPVSEVGLEHRRASFKAALQLGFRRYFQGDPGHLIVRAICEPIPSGQGVRQYLVVFDAVPGGTGYLAGLWQEERFLDLLAQALGALQSCVCRQDQIRDGCYRCLFAYQSQRDLPSISSREAETTLRAILDKRDTLKSVPTLSEVSLESRLESELETKFLEALRKRVLATPGLGWEERIKGGEIRWILRTRSRAWEITAQENLGHAEGVAPACRPDFMIRPANADPDLRPVAVFCDGLAYHVRPHAKEGRIADDIRKRTGVLRSGRYAVWSITWKDVTDFEESPNATTAPLLFGGLHMGILGKAGKRLGLTIDRAIGQRGSMDIMLAYLVEPDLVQWERLAATYAMTWLAAEREWLAPQEGASLESLLQTAPRHFIAESTALAGPDAAVLTRYNLVSWFGGLARSSLPAFQAGKVERFVLRLFDEHEARTDSTFEGSWRSFLQAWNILQFIDGTTVSCSELVSSDPAYEDHVETIPIAADRSNESYQPPSFGELDAPEEVAGEGAAAVAELLEFATEAARPLIEAVAAAGLPLPTEDFELPAMGVGCGHEPELAWPAVHLAVLAERQVTDRGAFDDADWTVLVQPVDANHLIDVLRAALENRKTTGGVV